VSGGAAELPVKSFATQRSFLTWLRANHGRSDGIWLSFAKKGSGARSVSYPEAVEAALCESPGADLQVLIRGALARLRRG
jgi:uncharacterized protein YdeI (YjbR/CyaY-like superfamily)